MDAPPVQYVTTADGYSIAYSVCGEGQPFVVAPPTFHHLQLVAKRQSTAAGSRIWHRATRVHLSRGRGDESGACAGGENPRGS